LAHWLQSQHGLAGTFGNWGFYALVALAVLALVSRIPYHLFYLSHRLMAIVLLLLAFHALVYFPFAQWPSALGVALAVVLLAGVAAGLVSLAGRIGVRRRGRGTVTDFIYYPELKVLQAEVEVAEGWPGHKPGQFAFVHGGRWEGRHPFTIASAWHEQDRKVVFVTKELGDFTSSLKDRARRGAAVKIEGPYGAFTFEDDCSLQIWIAGGVGITPFVAMMRQRQREPGSDDHEIHLFYTSESNHEEGMAKLSALAKGAAVHCHFLHTHRDGFLTGERVRLDVPAWQAASVWFCGPAAFGQAIRRDLVAHGLGPRRFHQELFAWR
jgi:predicted ferric reductase